MCNQPHNNDQFQHKIKGNRFQRCCLESFKRQICQPLFQTQPTLNPLDRLLRVLYREIQSCEKVSTSFWYSLF